MQEMTIQIDASGSLAPRNTPISELGRTPRTTVEDLSDLITQEMNLVGGGLPTLSSVKNKITNGIEIGAKAAGTVALGTVGYLGATVGEAAAGALDLVFPGDIYDSGTCYAGVTTAIGRLWSQ